MNYRALQARRPNHKNVGGLLFERVNRHARMLNSRAAWQEELAQNWKAERLLAAIRTNDVQIALLRERMGALDELLEQTVLKGKEPKR